MGEETTTSASNGEISNAADPKPEIGTPPGSDEISETTTQPSIDELKTLLEKAKSDLKKLHKESAGHRHEADELKKFKAQIDAEKLSDTEKQQLAQKQIEQQLADLQKEKEIALRQTQELRVTNEVFKHGQRLNIIDLDAATKLLDSSQIEYDDSGNPSNIEALLKTLVKERSWLVGKQQQTSGGATNPSRSQTSNSGDITPEYAKQVLSDPKEFGSLSPERRQQISQWIADNANKL
jgi:hypothetical protein